MPQTTDIPWVAPRFRFHQVWVGPTASVDGGILMRVRTMVASLALSLACTGANAQVLTAPNLAEGVATCARIVADPERLACFDRLTASPATTPVAQGTGAWVNRVDRDAMTDFVSSFWTLLSSTSIPDGVISTVRPVLVVRCQNNATSVFVDWNRFVTTDLDNRHPVVTRIDSAQSVRVEWSLSTDFEATFSTSPIPFLRTMSGATTFLAETTPFSSSPVRAEFRIAGIDQVIADVSSRCGWSP